MRRGKKVFRLSTLHHDYEDHSGPGNSYRGDTRVKISVYAYNYNHAKLLLNKWIRHENSEFSGYDLV